MTKINIVKMIAENAMIAAIYFVVTLATAPFAYRDIQFRIAEMLVLLCFWRPDFTIGLTLGCFLSNIMSPMPLDMLFGTLATLISCLGVAYLSPRMVVGIAWPVLVNAFVVGAELYFMLELPFWWNVLWVGIGELTVCVGGYIIWMLLARTKVVRIVLRPTRHAEITW